MFVVFYFMINLSLVFSASISEWNTGNVDLPEQFETVKNILSYLENNDWKNGKNSYPDFATMISRPVDQVFILFADWQRILFCNLDLIYKHCVNPERHS